MTKYDANELTTFRSTGKENAISGNWILSVNEDLQHNLWIGTLLHGVDKLNKATGKIKHYDNRYGFGNRVNKITILDDGSVWLCTENGLARYLPEKDSFKVYLPEEGNPRSLNSWYVFDMIQTRKGQCYVATWHPDIMSFDPDSGRFKSVSYTRDPALNIDYKKKILEDNQGNLWISASQHGLCKLNPATGKSVLYTDKAGELNTNILNGNMMLSPEGNVWIATDGGGIDIYHQADGTFSYINANAGWGNDLPGNQVYSLYRDDQNIIWAGFYDKGVAFYDPLSSRFGKTLFGHGDLTIFRGISVISLFQDSEGRIWAGTDGSGLYLFDPKKGMKVHKHDAHNPNSISTDVITSIGEEPSGRIIAGTYAAGLNLINTKSGVITKVNQKEKLNQSVNSTSIWEIFRDSKDNIWLGLLGSGIDLYNPRNHTFKNFGPGSGELNKVDHPNIMVIMEDNDGDIWFGTEGNGVFILDNQTRKITRMSTQTQADNSILMTGVIRSFFQDRKGLVWIGTEGDGVVIYNKKNGRIQRLTTSDGLPDMIIQGIQEDGKGNIWISTGYGLCMYNPYNKRIVNFTTRDGLSGNEFNADAFIQLNDGRMLAGSSKGLDVFNPENIVLNQNIPRVLITSLNIMNTEINAGDTINGRVLLKKQIWETGHVTLTHLDKIISLEFAALNFTLPEKCEYQYKLTGFDEDWVSTDAGHRLATYTNLPKGDYIFQAKASNNDGKWGNNICRLEITVLPPFWNTWLFYSVLVLTFFLLGYIIYRTRLNFYTTKFMQKQAEQEKRVIELENENLESELSRLTVFRFSRNRVLLEMKRKLEGLSVKARESVKSGLDKVVEEINQEINSDVDWKYIEPQLDRTYNNFITRLKEKHEDLSLSELKIAAYVRMNLTTKEISEFMHKTIRAVENDRYRLRKKLGLEAADSLQSYLMNI
ncbi:MAG TPA: two-component regulator propeller domain-containing protein [Bacteroidales bacterium]|nr:two-component regulator propeller domain-containing protein [Bacteroidales bacterium]